jgi:hypothetical protein
MADASVSLDLDAQQLYKELQAVQGHFASFASKVVSEGDKGAKGFENSFKGIESGIKGALGSLVAPVAALFSVNAVKNAIAHVIEYGSKIQDLSERFGVSAGALQRFGNAAELGGSSLEAVAKGFRFLEVNQAKALSGNDAMVAAFSELGVSVEDLKTLGPEQIMRKIGESSLNAADVVKVLGRSALELRPILAGIADGTIQLGNAIDDADVAKLDALDDAFKQMKQTVTIGLAPAITSLFTNFNASIAEASGKFAALMILTKASFSGSEATYDQAKKDAKAAIELGNAEAEDIRNPKVKDKKVRDLARAGLDEDGEAGESDDQGRPTKGGGGGGGGADAKRDKEIDALREKTSDISNYSSLGALAKDRDKLEKLKQDRIDDEREKAEGKDELDVIGADTDSKADRAEEQRQGREDEAREGKEADREKKAADKQAAADQKQAARDAVQDAKQAQSDEIRQRKEAANPTNLSLHDIASAPVIGSHATAIAREAEREEKIAKQQQLGGDLKGAQQHQNRAEQLKKELGLDNKIDRDALKDLQTESRDFLKEIRDNTKNIGQNK